MSEHRKTFDDVAEIYDRVRSTYPPALFDEFFSHLDAHASIVEIGPGTGQATKSLLARGAKVYAVEPGANLARVLRRNLGDVGQLVVLGVDFEDAALPLEHFDAVVAATAFHWIKPEARMVKTHALLKSGGWIAVIDTVQVAAPSDLGFFEAVQPLYRRFEHQANHYAAPGPEDVLSPIYGELETSDLFGAPLHFRYRRDQTYETSAYADLMRSYSATQVMPVQEQEELIGAVSKLVDEEFAGVVTRPLVFTLTMAQAAR